MSVRKLAAKVTVVVVAAIPLTGGVAQAKGMPVSDWVHETMVAQEQWGGCAWGQAVAGAGADNSQGSGSHRPSPCK